MLIPNKIYQKTRVERKKERKEGRKKERNKETAKRSRGNHQYPNQGLSINNKVRRSVFGKLILVSLPNLFNLFDIQLVIPVHVLL